MLARYLNGPRHGKTTALRGGVQPGWSMLVEDRGAVWLYTLERRRQGLVLVGRRGGR